MISKERKDVYKAGEDILYDQLNLVNMAKRINKGKLLLNDNLEPIYTDGNSKVSLIN